MQSDYSAGPSVDPLGTDRQPHFRQLQRILQRIFADLETAAQMELLKKLEWLYLNAGQCLIRQGDPSDALFIVVSGRLQVTVKKQLAHSPDSESIFIREMGAGEIIGETGVLIAQPRTATVTAIRSVTVVKLSRDDFEALVLQHPHIGLQVARMVANRQIGITPLALTPHAVMSIALVATDPSVPSMQVAQSLVNVLSQWGETLYLNSERFDAAFGKNGASQVDSNDPLHLSVIGWLNELELHYRYIVYECDRVPSAWTKKVLQHSDRILVLKDAQASDVSPDLIEQVLVEQFPSLRPELLLLQPATCVRPSGTIRWLQHRSTTVHYHLRLSNDADWQRLGRRLTGQANAVVLSAGGSSAAAHAGVLRAITEADIPVDMIGGTSAGAITGGIFAFEMDNTRVWEFGHQNSSAKRILDYTLPLTSLLAGAKATGVLQGWLGEIGIEDLWIPYFSVSCNLSRVQLVIHDRGPLWLAIRTSSAIPGVYPPLTYNGDLLVDGGIMNYFPVDIMRQRLQPGTIYGVNLTPPKDSLQNYQFGADLSGWKILWHRMNPLAKSMRVPSLMDILMRSLAIRSIETLRLTIEMVDVLFQPEVDRFRSDDWDSFDELYQIGYECARKTLSQG